MCCCYCYCCICLGSWLLGGCVDTEATSTAAAVATTFRSVLEESKFCHMIDIKTRYEGAPFNRGVGTATCCLG